MRGWSEDMRIREIAVHPDLHAGIAYSNTPRARGLGKMRLPPSYEYMYPINKTPRR